MNGRAQELFLSVVVIGRNEGARLIRCLESVRAMRVPGGAFEVIYVDSASTDGSCECAAQLGARVIRVNPPRPTAALGRNAGWRAARSPYVLFLDGDTVLDPDFVTEALKEFADERTAVVWGHRREINTRASVYNRVLDLDWVYPPGVSDFCGGDALVRREVLEKVRGYDETLIAGEEPEMCRRIRALGYVIRHIDRPMTGHDLAMTRFTQYWRRAVRAGYAYAEVSARFRLTDSPLWEGEARRNTLRGGALVLLPLAALFLTLTLHTLIPLVLLAAFIILLVGRTARKVGWKSPDISTRLLYAVHSHLQQLPILAGQLSYGLNRRRGRARELIEYKEAHP